MKKFFSTILVSISFFFLFSLTTEAKYGFVESESYRTFVPLRYISEEVGANVKWDATEKSITINNGSKSYKLYIGSKWIRSNGQLIKEMDTMPVLYNGSSYVPVRAISDLLNYSIEWKQATQQAIITVSSSKKLIINTYPESVFKRPKWRYDAKTISVSGSSKKVNVVSINLLNQDVNIQAAFANGKKGSTASLSTVAAQNNAKVAINANYFDAYTSSSYKQPYNGVIREGVILNNFAIVDFSVFYITKDGVPGISGGNEFRSGLVASNYKTAVQAGPRLIKNGNISVNPVAEGFSSPKILSSPGARSAVGITKSQQVLFVTGSGLTIDQLANVMKQLGAYQAMNLDGGASSGLYFQGSLITTPGRALSTVLTVK
ncbi:phosphodiester glycosidase family protein [Mangrovibacillus cuniculi]|uniref:Copper amine oxidase n=1 Tax=Mangrovibacillus cuniculi TaxID=2593652 RepID=A0A7S8HG25_9BACI|nr:phosphodiester glycosidase family protein [Mangrovibacillus cuniculi]QPC47539.1 copper amine oxidase [Mangrovibacillus cuniculi]